jgi:hypothetical protein
LILYSHTIGLEVRYSGDDLTTLLMLHVLFTTGSRAVSRVSVQTAMLYVKYTAYPPVGFAIGCGDTVTTT